MPKKYLYNTEKNAYVEITDENKSLVKEKYAANPSIYKIYETEEPPVEKQEGGKPVNFTEGSGEQQEQPTEPLEKDITIEDGTIKTPEMDFNAQALLDKKLSEKYSGPKLTFAEAEPFVEEPIDISIPEKKDIVKGKIYTPSETIAEKQKEIVDLNKEIDKIPEFKYTRMAGDPQIIRATKTETDLYNKRRDLIKLKNQKEKQLIDLKNSNDDILSAESGSSYFLDGKELTRSQLRNFATGMEFTTGLESGDKDFDIKVENDEQMDDFLLSQKEAADVGLYEQMGRGFFTQTKDILVDGIDRKFAESQQLLADIGLIDEEAAAMTTVLGSFQPESANKAFALAKMEVERDPREKKDFGDAFLRNYSAQIQNTNEELRGKQLERSYDVIDLLEAGEIGAASKEVAKMSVESLPYTFVAMTGWGGAALIANSVQAREYYDLRNQGVSKEKALISSGLAALIETADAALESKIFKSNISKARKITNQTGVAAGYTKQQLKDLSKNVFSSYFKEMPTELAQGTLGELNRQWATDKPIDFESATRAGVIESLAAAPTSTIISSPAMAKLVYAPVKRYKDLSKIQNTIGDFLFRSAETTDNTERKILLDQSKMLVNDFIAESNKIEQTAKKATEEESNTLKGLTLQEFTLERTLENTDNLSPETIEVLQSKLDDIGKQKSELINNIDSREDVAVEDVAAPEEVIEEQEYNQFVDEGVVSEERIQDIADKVRQQQELTPREQEIFTDKTSEVNQKIAEFTPTEEVSETVEAISPLPESLKNVRVARVGDTFDKGKRGEAINEKEIEEAQSVLMDELNEIEKSNLPQEQKDAASAEVEKLFNELENYELTTETKTRQITQKRPTRVVREGVKEQTKSPQERSINRAVRMPEEEGVGVSEGINTQIQSIRDKIEKEKQRRSETRERRKKKGIAKESAGRIFTNSFKKQEELEQELERLIKKEKQGRVEDKAKKKEQVTVVLEEQDGKIVLQAFDKDGSRTTAKELELESVNDLELVDTLKDEDGKVIGATVRNKNNDAEVFSIMDEELALDYAIEKTKAEVGEMSIEEESVFEEYEEVKKRPTKKKPTKEVVKEEVTEKVEPTKPITEETLTEEEASALDDILGFSGQKKRVYTDNKSESDKRRLKRVNNALDKIEDSFQKIFPNLYIGIAEDSDMFARFAKEQNTSKESRSRGVFTPINVEGEPKRYGIILNPDFANVTTAFHEAFHALMKVNGFNNEQARAVTSRMIKSVQKGATPELNENLERFVSQYETPEQSEEYMSELFGILSYNYSKQSGTVKGIIKRWLRKLAEIIGLKPKNTLLSSVGLSDSDAATVNMLNVLADKMSRGKVLSKEDVTSLRMGGPLTVQQVAADMRMDDEQGGIKKQMPQSASKVLYNDSDVLPKPSKKKSNSQVAQDLAEVAAEYYGGNIITSNTITAKQEEEIIQVGTEEAIKAFEDSGKSAADWYSTAIQKAMAVAAVIHPSLSSKEEANKYDIFNKEKDPVKAANLAMRIALAITSQNLNVEANAKYANEQFDILKKTGKFDASREYGTKATSISSNLRLANELINKIGLNQSENFITKDFNTARLEEAASEVLGKKVKISGLRNDLVNGAALFGPKIGQGFLQNLMGKFEPVTIDLWLRRTWGRWTGDVVGVGVTEERMARLLNGISEAKKDTGFDIPDFMRKHKVIKKTRPSSGSSYSTMSDSFTNELEDNDRFRNDISIFAKKLTAKANTMYKLIKNEPMSKELYRDFMSGKKTYGQTANELQIIKDKTSDKYKDYASKEKAKGLTPIKKSEWVKTQNKKEGRDVFPNNKAISSRKPEWVKASTTIINDLKPIDIPSNQDRKVITRVVKEIKNRMEKQGYSVTNADVQALLWYPEKDIWSKLRGEEESNLKQSYDEQFIKIAEKQGLGKEAKAAAEGIKSRRTTQPGGTDGRTTDVKVSRPIAKKETESIKKSKRQPREQLAGESDFIKKRKQKAIESFYEGQEDINTKEEAGEFSMEEAEKATQKLLINSLHEYFGDKYFELNGKSVRIADHAQGTIYHSPSDFSFVVTTSFTKNTGIDDTIRAYEDIQDAIDIILDRVGDKVPDKEKLIKKSKRTAKDLKNNWTPTPIKSMRNSEIAKSKEVMQRAAIKLLKGEITQKKWVEVREKYSPINKIGKLFQASTLKHMNTALGKKADKLMAPVPKDIRNRVGARLDIPSYLDHNAWVVTLHDGKGPVISYRNAVRLKDVEFVTNPNAALMIASGLKDKSTFARMVGEMVDIPGNTAEEQGLEAQFMIEDIMNNKEWTQVGMNPFRQSWFWNRETGKPVVAADEVIQVGGLVYAKNITETEPGDKRFEVRGRLEPTTKDGKTSYKLNIKDFPEERITDPEGETIKFSKRQPEKNKKLKEAIEFAKDNNLSPKKLNNYLLSKGYTQEEIDEATPVKSKPKESIKRLINKVSRLTDNNEARAIVAKGLRELLKDSKLSQFSKRTINKVITSLKNTNVSNMQKMLDKVDDAISNDEGRLERIKRYKNRSIAIKRIAKIGPLKELQDPFIRMMGIDPKYLSKKAQKEYDSVLSDILNINKKYDKTSRDTFKAKIDLVLDSYDIDSVRAKEIADRINELIDPTKTLNTNLARLEKDKKITKEERELITRFKSLLDESSVADPMAGYTEEEIEEYKGMLEAEKRESIEEDFIETLSQPQSAFYSTDDAGAFKLSEEERRYVKEANSITLKDIQELSLRDAKSVVRALEAMKAGFLTPELFQGVIKVRGVRGNMSIPLNEIKESGFIDKISSKISSSILNIGRKKKITGIGDRLRSAPTKNYEQVLKTEKELLSDGSKRFKGTNIYKSLFKPTSTAFSKSEQTLTKIEDKLKNATALLSRNQNERFIQKAKVMVFQIQREYDSNIGNKEVNQAKDWINATIKDKDTALNERDIIELEKIRDGYLTDGQVDAKKLYDSLTTKEKKFLETIDGVYDELTFMARMDAAVQGMPFIHRENYIHLPKSGTKTSEISNDFDSLFDSFMNASVKNKAAIQRTGKTHSISFDPVSNAYAAARKISVGYHMYPVIKSARVAFSGLKNRAETRFEKDLVNELESIYDRIINSQYKNVTKNKILADNVFRYLTKAGYYSQLGGLVKAASELGTNTLHAVMNHAGGLVDGYATLVSVDTKTIDKALENTDTTQMDRLTKTAKFDSKDIESKLLSKEKLFNAEEMTGELAASAKTVGKVAAMPFQAVFKLNESLITKPDEMVIRPLFVGEFQNKFKQLTGQKLNWEKLANDESYRDRFQEAINQASEQADSAVIDTSASTNPFDTIPSNISDPDASNWKKAFQVINRYMTNFRVFEYYSAVKGVQNLLGKGEISRGAGMMLLASTLTRMAVYRLGIDYAFGLIFSMLGMGEDEDEIKEEDITRSVLSGIVTLAFGRNLGNFTQSVINFGIEYANMKFGEGITWDSVTKDGEKTEYDPYKGMVFSKIPLKPRPGQDVFSNVAIGLSGPLAPIIKTTARGATLANRSIYNETKESRDKNKNELFFKTPFDIAGSLGFIPDYKDLKKLNDRYWFGGNRDTEKKTKGKILGRTRTQSSRSSSTGRKAPRSNRTR